MTVTVEDRCLSTFEDDGLEKQPSVLVGDTDGSGAVTVEVHTLDAIPLTGDDREIDEVDTDGVATAVDD